MKKQLFILLSFLFFSFNSFAIELSKCTSDDNIVSNRFVRCVNINFDIIKMIKRVEIKRCENSGNELSMEFEDCINSNFRNIEWKLNLELDRCGDFGQTLKPYFECVNDNFSIVNQSIQSF